MDLQYPEKKMSTTGGTQQGLIYVTDEPDAIIKKFKSAVTDSGREIRHSHDKPGISNLLEILAVVRGSSIEQLEREFDGAGYGDFKLAVGEAVVDYLAPVRERYNAVREDETALEAILGLGAGKAREIASQTMRDVRTRDGRRTGRSRKLTLRTGPAGPPGTLAASESADHEPTAAAPGRPGARPRGLRGSV